MRSTRKPPKYPLDHEPEAVKYARDKAGLTQQQLADLVGVSRTLITEIENGTRNATPIVIAKLATAMNCPRVILERKREPKTATSADVDVQQLRHAERAQPVELSELRR
jgi:transcriptional regulator with XRE-family HTH domain